MKGSGNRVTPAVAAAPYLQSVLKLWGEPETFVSFPLMVA